MLALLAAIAIAETPVVIPQAGSQDALFQVEVNVSTGLQLAAAAKADVEDCEGLELVLEVYKADGTKEAAISAVTLTAVPDTKGRFWTGKVSVPSGFPAGEYTVRVKVASNWEDSDDVTIIKASQVGQLSRPVAFLSAA